MEELHSGEWLEANRAQWDEKVPLHVGSHFYDQSKLRGGNGELYPIEERDLAELFPEGLEGKRILHLQCHFGADSLVLAQRGATVVGLDFSKPAVVAARHLAEEVGLSDRARFVHSNVYDARHVLPEPESFDAVYTTWGTILWLPDVAEWARIIAWYLKPGGKLYFADGHPAALVFDGDHPTLPEFHYPYENAGQPEVLDDSGDYAVKNAVIANTKTFEWMHPLGETITALLEAGLRLDFFREHYEVPWRMYKLLQVTPERTYRWPDKNWLPLSMSIGATRV